MKPGNLRVKQGANSCGLFSRKMRASVFADFYALRSLIDEEKREAFFCV